MLVQANIATLLTILSIATISTAHSPAWPTIAYTETLGPLHHEILPRHLNNNYKNNNNIPSTPFTKRGDPSSSTAINTLIEQKDKIRLRFQAFNKTFYLHLEPNNDLLHPDLFSSSSSSSRLASSSSVYDDIKPFKGVVVEDDHFSNQKWERAMSINQAEEQRSTVEQQLYEEGVLGWARMMVEHDEENDDSIVLRGAFTTRDDTYHITSRQHYHVQKRSDDHSPSSSRAISSQLIIYRDSDLRKPTKKLYARKDFASKEEEAEWEERQATTCGAGYVANSVKHSSNNGSWSGAGTGAGGEAHGYYYPPDLTAPIPMGGGTGPSGFFNMASTTFRKRSTAEDNIMVKVAGPNPVPTGCPTTRMINYMGVAADCTYVRSYGGLSNARKQIFADFNTASGIYESTFNIALGIIAVEIESMNCPKTPVKGKAWNQECSTQYTINDRLSDFSYWRGTRPKDGAGLWHLMTQCSSGPIVGIAWTGALCQMSAQSQGGSASTGGGAAATPAQYTAGTGVSSISPNEWMVVAHEVGHGFGANHDCTSTNCASPSAIAAAACCPYSTSDCDAGNRFIMNPSEQSVKSTFSPCSIHAICTTISSKAGSCLQPITAAGTKPFQSTQANVCGNGIREKGEQCDCGSAAECALDPCCDGATCKFKGAAVCDDMNDDCCRNCQLAPKGLVCRSAVSNCDIAETCSGSTAICPDDVQVPNLSLCDILGAGNTTLGKGQCADGLCTSRDLQCAQQQRPGIDKQCAGGMNQCELLCNDPQGNANSCMKIPGLFFVDGSPCGSSSDGICVSGKCELPGGWVKNHLSIFIPIICLVVVLIGAGIGTYILLSRRKARRSLKARLSAHALPNLPPHSEGSGGSDGAATNSACLVKGKDADVPKWMLTGDRHTTQASMPRRSSQIVISRRASLSSQNVLRNDSGDVVPMSTAPELAAIYMQQQQFLQQQRQQRGNGYGYDGYTAEEEPYQDMYQSHEELHQQQLRQQRHLQEMFGYQSPTGFMSPAPVYSPEFGYHSSSSSPPLKQDFDHYYDPQKQPYFSTSPLSQGQQGHGHGQPSPLMHPQNSRPQSPQQPQQAHYRSHHLNLQQQHQRYQQEQFDYQDGDIYGSNLDEGSSSDSQQRQRQQQQQQQQQRQQQEYHQQRHPHEGHHHLHRAVHPFDDHPDHPQ